MFNRLTQRWAERTARQRGLSLADMKKILEEYWVLIGNIITLSLATYAMLNENWGCWFGNLEKCLIGWPNHSVRPAVLWYYNIEFAWYIHLLLKNPLKYGEPDGKDMMLHHVASLLLLVLSKGCNLTRGGVVVLTLFSISNPALHAAKICNQLIPNIRVIVFCVFSLLFFITRVVMVPLVILRLSLAESRRVIPYAVEDFYVTYVIINALLVALYIMQLQWMWAIVRVLKKSASEGSNAAAELSSKLDPAKRFSKVEKTL